MEYGELTLATCSFSPCGFHVWFHPPADSGSSHCRFRPGSRHGIPAGAWQFHGLVSSTSATQPSSSQQTRLSRQVGHVPDASGGVRHGPHPRAMTHGLTRYPPSLGSITAQPMDNSGGPQLHLVWSGPTTDRPCRINALREHAPRLPTKQQPNMGASRCLFGPIESISDFTRNIETATTCARAIWAVAAPVPPVFACSAQGPLRHPAPT